MNLTGRLISTFTGHSHRVYFEGSIQLLSLLYLTFSGHELDCTAASNGYILNVFVLCGCIIAIYSISNNLEKRRPTNSYIQNTAPVCANAS